jgi:hypothetical protein
MASPAHSQCGYHGIQWTQLQPNCPIVIATNHRTQKGKFGTFLTVLKPKSSGVYKIPTTSVIDSWDVVYYENELLLSDGTMQTMYYVESKGGDFGGAFTQQPFYGNRGKMDKHDTMVIQRMNELAEQGNNFTSGPKNTDKDTLAFCKAVTQCIDC